MPRDIPIGNGRVLIAFDKNAILRDLYFPFVGEENHTKGRPFRLGVWVDGSFSWIPNGWIVANDYLGDSLVTNVKLSRSDLEIVSNDLVDFEENIYLKKITIENKTDREKDIRIFFGHDFHIYSNEIGDTAAFRPENKSIIHYKGERYFLINIWANNKFGIDLYATGKKEEGNEIGTWKDAEDGVLSGNPIAQGSVDSVIAVPINIAPRAKESFYYWMAIGKNWEEVKALDELVKKKTPDVIFKRTYDYWKLWVDKEPLNDSLIPQKITRQYKQSLLICRTQINDCGSIIAANDSDAVYFNRDTYSYMWPRDGSLVAYGLDLAGYEITQKFFKFCAKIVEKDGYFSHKYTPSGSEASSWHPWVKDKKAQLPIQEDETALVIWALWKHYEQFRDLDFIQPLYDRLIKKCADFMMNYRNLHTGLPMPSYDLWEERQGVLTFTVSAVFGGLMAAANFAACFGEEELAEEYRQGAMTMREGMNQYLYLKEEKRFARMINFKRDGSIEVDKTIDASLFGVFAFGAYNPDDEKVVSTMSQIERVLASGGGISRYENDSYYRLEGESLGNPWFVTTLWLAQYYIAKAKTKADLDKALEILSWVADHALKSGVLAEQINPKTDQPLSVSPLTWSHGTFIIAVQEYLKKRSSA
jgi:glucoamylase